MDQTPSDGGSECHEAHLAAIARRGGIGRPRVEFLLRCPEIRGLETRKHLPLADSHTPPTNRISWALARII